MLEDYLARMLRTCLVRRLLRLPIKLALSYRAPMTVSVGCGHGITGGSDLRIAHPSKTAMWSTVSTLITTRHYKTCGIPRLLGVFHLVVLGWPRLQLRRH